MSLRYAAFTYGHAATNAANRAKKPKISNSARDIGVLSLDCLGRFQQLRHAREPLPPVGNVSSFNFHSPG